jgi:hypothetical protein
MRKRLTDLKSKKKFNYALNLYRKIIENPETLSQKIYNLALDVNGEYNKIKTAIEIEKNKKIKKYTFSMPKQKDTKDFLDKVSI